MDTDRGRKAVGGKLEVRLRIREPLVDKDVKIEKWKWLVIDLHLTSRKVRTVSLLFETVGTFIIKYEVHWNIEVVDEKRVGRLSKDNGNGNEDSRKQSYDWLNEEK